MRCAVRTAQGASSTSMYARVDSNVDELLGIERDSHRYFDRHEGGHVARGVGGVGSVGGGINEAVRGGQKLGWTFRRAAFKLLDRRRVMSAMGKNTNECSTCGVKSRGSREEKRWKVLVEGGGQVSMCLAGSWVNCGIRWVFDDADLPSTGAFELQDRAAHRATTTTLPNEHTYSVPPLKEPKIRTVVLPCIGPPDGSWTPTVGCR